MWEQRPETTLGAGGRATGTSHCPGGAGAAGPSEQGVVVVGGRGCRVVRGQDSEEGGMVGEGMQDGEGAGPAGQPTGLL